MEHFDLAAVAAKAAAGGQDYLAFLDTPTLTVGLYRVARSDDETHLPHPRDEVYYVLRGCGMIRAEGRDQAVGPGSVVFVPAHEPHHFHDIREELHLLVFFSSAPVPEGER